MHHPIRHIGIVGCGVAGLAAAVVLARVGGQRVTLIERAAKVGPVGAGLLLQPSGQMALGAMGLLDAAIKDAEPIEALHAWTHRGRTLVRLPYAVLGPGLSGYGVHRGDLFTVLFEHARGAGVEFRFGVTVCSSRQTEREIVAIDEAGEAHGPFDVLIAADGARSRLRGAAELRASVREFPLGAAWFSGRSDAIRGRLHQVTRGSRQLIGLLPVGRGRCSLFCALPPGGKEALAQRGLAALKEDIIGLCPEAESLVAQIGSLDDLATARYQLVHLPSWSFRRLVCIGDAAHATTPHLGQGVNLALLDALAVGSALNAAGDDLLGAIARAAQLRRKQVMWSWRLSNMLGPVFQDEGWMLAAARDRVLPWLPRVPGVDRLMVGTMAGLHTGPLARLSIGE
jgi:2-polyprenyl-6-methoxyphenol hydroxylase-like FAD-dependent oxidoreductase